MSRPRPASGPRIDVHPLVPERWRDLATLFGPKGAYGGCWCMWFRMTSAEFEEKAGAGTRRAMKRLVDGGRVPGLLAYADGEPVGWVSVAPRGEFGRIERSPTLKPVDDRPVWSVVCFYIARAHRNRGVARALLDAAVDYAADRGAEVVEAYPDVPRKDRMPPYLAYRGTLPMFESAEFREVARRGVRPIVRKAVRR